MMCSTYAWRSNESLSARATVYRQSRVPEVYEPLVVRTVRSSREEPAAGAGEDCEGCKGCEGYERQERGEPAPDSSRNARTRVFAAVIQSGVVTSNQISRVFRRSQVS